METQVEFIWVPSDLGGHRGPPYEGMRCQIRWQRHVDEAARCLRDIECVGLEASGSPSRWTGQFRFTFEDSELRDRVVPGAAVEFLNGYRVLAVGVIRGP